jgi:hypothetical protein
MARQRPHKAGSTATAPDDKRPDESQRQEQAARLEQRLNDPEWRPLAEHVRKKLGDQFTLHWAELRYLAHGTNNPCPLPFSLRFTVPQLLAVLSRHSPKLARRLLDAVLDNRHEKRKRPTAERNATWKRWHDESGIGPAEIARRWKRETGELVEANAVKQALRRTGRSG